MLRGVQFVLVEVERKLYSGGEGVAEVQGGRLGVGGEGVGSVGAGQRLFSSQSVVEKDMQFRVLGTASGSAQGVIRAMQYSVWSGGSFRRSSFIVIQFCGESAVRAVWRRGILFAILGITFYFYFGFFFVFLDIYIYIYVYIYTCMLYMYMYVCVYIYMKYVYFKFYILIRF